MKRPRSLGRDPLAYWYIGQGGLNFGDALNPLLYRRLANVTLAWAPADEAEIFAIGSNIELIPDDFEGAILGTGIASGVTRRSLPGAQIFALRGNLTACCLGVYPPLLADLGLLAPDLLDERPPVDIEHGMVRHFYDTRRVFGYDIDVLGGPDHVVREVARCRRITSSSLHGLILADALGIPNRWSPHRSAEAIKFVDYASAFGDSIFPYVWRLADKEQVAAKQAALREALWASVA